MGPIEAYHFVIDELADPRMVNFPLIASPIPLLLILISYMVFILHVGPNYMKDREPFDLKYVRIVYNLIAASASGIIFYGLVTSGYTTTLSLGCEPIVVSYEPEALRMTKWVWWLLMLKVFELGDTIMFVLRKKTNQLTFLHIYHHNMTVILSWIATKYAPGGMWTFNLIPNCAVHVVMYLYYLLVCFGPRIQKIIVPYKKYVTRMQLIQFVMMTLHTSQGLLPSCEPTKKLLACIYMSQVLIIFYMFCDFYRKSYMRKKTQ